MSDIADVIPLGSKVVVRMDEAKSVSDGGIEIPDAAQERAPHGEVQTLGLGPKDDPDFEFTVQEGDRVLMQQYGGVELEPGLVIMDEQNILGFLPTPDSIQPILGRVVVRMLPPDERKGLIWLPAISQETQEFGVVVGVADDCITIQKGDYVYVGKTQGTHYRTGGSSYIILDEKAIKMVVEKSEDSDEH